MITYEIITPSVSSSAQTPAEHSFRSILNSFESYLILSPHFDDAVLSMGSLLAYLLSTGKPVEVINVFTLASSVSSTLTEKLLRQAQCSGPEKYFQQRAEEDQVALLSLGPVRVTNLNLIDAPWRPTDSGEPLYPQTTWRTYDVKKDIISADTLTTTFKKMVLPKCRQLVFAPLARGRHNDHIVVRNVSSELFSQVIYYMDFPYSASFVNEEEFIQSHKLIPIEWTGDYYHQKSAAILKYHTQLTSLFEHPPLKLPYECFYSLS